MKIDFVKTLTATGPYKPGTIYFESSTNLIKVATATNQYTVYGGVRSADWDAENQTLDIVNQGGEEFIIDFSGYLTIADYESDEEVIAAALNDLNDRLIALDASIMTDASISALGYIKSYTETDPIFSASAAAGITSTDITNWNNKVSNVQADWNAASGLSAILNKPTIPSTLDQIADGSTRKLANYLPLSGGTMNADASINILTADGNQGLSMSPMSLSVYSPNSLSSIGENCVTVTDQYDGVTELRPEALYVLSVSGASNYIGTWYENGDIKRKISSSTTYTYTFPNKTGTFAMTSDIPSAVTESTVSGWGFTKNAGTLTGVKFNNVSATINGTVAEITATIPTQTTDASVSGWGYIKSYTETDPIFSASPAAGITAANITTWNNKQSAITFNTAYNASSNKAATMADIPKDASIAGMGYIKSYTETDPVFSASAAAGITSSDITNWNGKTSNIGTITGITMNGSSKGTSGVVNLGTVVTSEVDPVFSASAAAGITSSNISTWNAKQDALVFNTAYNSSTNKVATMADVPKDASIGEMGYIKSYTETDPTVPSWAKAANKPTYTASEVGALPSTTVIPTVNNATLTISQDGSVVGTFTANSATDVSINLTGGGGSGSGLPAVTSADNGKILQVVGGEWTLVVPVCIYSGSSNPDNNQGTNGDLYLQI